MKNAKRLTAALGLLVLCSASAASAAEPQAAPGTRVEKDLLGEKAIPADAYYGVQTARALENFQISGVNTNHYPGFFEAWAIVKLAAARANTDVGAMKKEKLALIEKACQAVRDGKYHDQFRTDWYQGGAGTSTNMNANEVLANVALELAGHPKGSYEIVEPHDDLNMSQSTNDSYPTAIKIALILRNDKLVAELEQLAASFRAKGNAYLKIVKMGRTELQDAVPMTVGQEFHAFAASLEGEIQLLRDAEKYLYAVNMGATAIGTGLNAPEGYAVKCAQHLAQITGKPIVPAKDMLAATWDQQGFVVYSGALKSVAIKLSKIAADLILLTSGPRAGLAEINLPAMQPGSSIMPGKVNPVIPELVNLVAFRVMGNDYTVTLAAHSRTAPAERLRAGGRCGDDGVAAPPLQHLEGVPHQVRRRDHPQREGARALPGDDGRDRDRAQPGAGLRQGHRAGRRGLQERQGHPGGHPREEDPDRAADRRPPRSRSSCRTWTGSSTRSSERQ